MEINKLNMTGTNVKKAYIINLAFNTWQNQLWFCAVDGTDSANLDEDFKKAEHSLDAVGDTCTNSNDFFAKVVEHFESYGFMRIQK